MSAKLKEWLIVGGLVALVAGYFIWRQAERHAGAIAILTHQSDSTVQAIVKDTARIAQEARQKASEAERQRTVALAQVAAGRALQAHTDSVAREASNARAMAERTLADSLASVVQLRASLSAVVRSGVADSIARSAERAADLHTISDLLRVVSADSLALTAERQHSASLQALSQTLAQEVALLKQSQPSGVGKVIWGVAGLAGGYFVGRGSR